MTNRSRKYITRKKNRYKVRLRFGDPKNDIVIDVRKFASSPGMRKIGENEWVSDEEPVPNYRKVSTVMEIRPGEIAEISKQWISENDYKYEVKLVNNER